MSKRILVCGAGGFIGGHMVTQLESEGHHVIGVDVKFHDHKESDADEFLIRDLRDFGSCMEVTRGIDEVYQFAADMGGAGYVFTGEHDDDILHNSATINLNVAEACKRNGVDRVFYSSSACIYPERNQMDPDNPNCIESSAYPADPDSEYGWEKLFSERLWKVYSKHFDVRIARYHNIYGPFGTWDGGKEKAPAAMIRKAYLSSYDLEVWGDGQQTRSFLYIDDCIRMTRQLMDSNFTDPVNIGSEEIIKINDLAQMAIDIVGSEIDITNIDGPEGVRGRNSENSLYIENVGAGPDISLRDGMQRTAEWIGGEL
jgi:GDP-D-mannose 3',5'-epimerase